MGQPGQRNVQRDVTFTGGFRVICDTRKFIAISSQFMYSSTLSRIAYKKTNEMESEKMIKKIDQNFIA